MPVARGTTRLVVVASQPGEANFGKSEAVIEQGLLGSGPAQETSFEVNPLILSAGLSLQF